MLKIISSFVNINVINKLSIVSKHTKLYSSSSIFSSKFSLSMTSGEGYLKDTKWNDLSHFQRNIFIYRSGDVLWEGVTGPPGRIKKRARGKRRVLRNKVDLNFGRKLGDNVMNYKWPGLNAPIVENNNKLNPVQGTKDEEYSKKIFEIRNKMNKKKGKRSIPPLKRGWSGARMGGQSCGPPLESLGQKWEGFDSRVLEMKMVCTMTANKGRTGRYSSVVMVGNFQGLAGVGKSKNVTFRHSLRDAKANAMRKLVYYNIRENRTLWHPDFIQDHCTKLFAKPMHEGYGLVCHRVIKTMCQLIGIKDMYAKVEGSVDNYQVIVRAFMALLRKQETYQDMANRLQLKVVEVRPEFDNFPRLLASPESGPTRSPDLDENLDFETLHVDGRVFRIKKYTPFFLSMKGPQHYARIRHRFRNQEHLHRTRQVYEYLCEQGHLAKVPVDLEANK